MSDFHNIAKSIDDPENLAKSYLKYYSKNHHIDYPINPFKMLLDEGLNFAIRDFGNLEGVYIPAENQDDSAIIGININRPITRQRFTAAHELYHHFKDKGQQVCNIGSNLASERFAENFASSILMPLDELYLQVKKRKNNDYVEDKDILEIADYFGVSFQSCLFRIAYKIQAVQGNTESAELKKRARKYKPDIRRKECGFNNVSLFEGLINSYHHSLRLVPNEFMLNIFQNDYIYNDSRIEGIDIDIETAAEIVTDIRLNQQNSKYCSEENEAFLSIAGHAAMYSYIFKTPTPSQCSVFEIIKLNQKLFSFFPYPEFGGQLRQNNTLVLNTKFETVDYNKIIQELIKIDKKVNYLYANRATCSVSSYIEAAVRIHHELTVVHPFNDGNGRTLRAFFNVLMIRNSLTPTYIKLENKNEYIKALAVADEFKNYALLYEFFFKSILKTNIDLTREL